MAVTSAMTVLKSILTTGDAGDEELELHVAARSRRKARMMPPAAFVSRLTPERVRRRDGEVGVMDAGDIEVIETESR